MGKSTVKKKLKDRRQSSRLDVSEGIVLIVGSNHSSTNRLRNISRHGLSFNSDLPVPDSVTDLQINIILNPENLGKDLFMTNVSGKVLAHRSSTPKNMDKRYCVQFTDLTAWQKQQLKSFFCS